MRTLTIKNIPDELYERLKTAAQAHHRSLNSEILYCVEQTLVARKIEVNTELAIPKALRAKTASHPISETELDAAKNDGRP